MPAGPLLPISAYPITNPKVFPEWACYNTPPTYAFEGLGVMASLDGDAIWQLLFQMPGTLPEGTCKLRLLALCDDASHDAKVNPKWASVAVGEDPSAATLQAEGTQTLSWGASDSLKFKELVVTLDADTPVGGELLLMNLTFEASGWTLDATSVWFASIIWE